MQKTRKSIKSRLRQFAADVARKFRPDKIILFGSYSYGKPENEYGDVDVFVIVRTKKNPLEFAALIHRTISYDFPLDLIVMRPEEVERRLEENDSFVTSILRRGKILYETDNSMVGRESRG